MNDFAHLHVHSHYSLLDGLAKVDALVERAKELGMGALAITDHGAMYGVIEFVQLAQSAGIKPIIGVEAYLAPNGHAQKRGRVDSDPRHITLLAKNNDGYRNLLKLVSTGYLAGFYYKPRIDYDLLRKHSQGLIVLSGCMNGDIPQAILNNQPDHIEKLIKWHLDVFGRDHFYFEVQHHPNLAEQNKVNQALIELGKRHRIGLVATADSHYIHPGDDEAQDVLVCVQTGKKVHDKDRLCMKGEDFSLKSPSAVKEAWKKQPEAIDNTLKIAEMCQVQFEFGKNQLPPYPLPPGTTADEALKKLCAAGLQERYDENIPQDAPARLEYELSVIKKTGFASYFLLVADFVNEAKRRGILVGPGRGSAAGSLVSYLTRITNVDPLVYNLLFERFLNPQRVSMPDIDLDFADDRRDEVIDYVREKYGADHVAQIITFGTMAARAAVRDAGRALGMPYAFCDQVAKTIPPFHDFQEALANSTELRELYEKNEEAKKLIDTARKLEGVCRHASTHAAGVVITEKPLTEYLPLQLAQHSSGTNAMVTQYAMHDIEALGLLKIDFLGLKNLTVIQNTLRRLADRLNQQIDLDKLPLDDASTYQLLQAGQTTGVFQLESAGMKRYLKELKPTEFEDIMSMVALYRPGPMDSIPDFIAGKHNRRKITYLHPVLEPILNKTYGVIVTQDQVLQIAREFAGFSYAEADILRKAVGKKIKSLLDEQREKFIEGAMATQKVSKSTAGKVWDFIEPFARYGFNRAHAACYAMIAYQTAYLKANFPADFMAALLTSDLNNLDRMAIEMAEALSLHLTILPPDINESDHDFTVVSQTEGKQAIRFGLAGIKNVGDNVVDAIVAERRQRGAFAKLGDFFSRLPSKILNRKSLESLVKAGAFDGLGERQQLLDNLELLLTFSRTLAKQLEQGQKNLFGSSEAAPQITLPALQAAEPASSSVRTRWEKELLGMYVSEHPLSNFQQKIARIATPLQELSSRRRQPGSCRVAGVITQIKKIITKSHQPMLFVQIEDLTGKAEVLVFPTVLQKTSEVWVEGGLVLIEGKLSDKDDEIKILANKVEVLSDDVLRQLQPRRPQASRIVIHLPLVFSTEKLKSLQTTLSSHHLAQGLQVELVIQRQGRPHRLKTTYRVAHNAAVIRHLEQIVGEQRVQYH